MAIPAHIPEIPPIAQVLSPLVGPAVPLAEAQLPELVEDFFRWLQDEWQLPVLSPYPAPPPLILPMRPLDEETYTIRDMCQLWGWSRAKVSTDLIKFGIPLAGFGQTRSGNGRLNIYRGQDLLPAVQHWEWHRLSDQVNAHWRRFFQERCGSCHQCQRYSLASPTFWLCCTKNHGRMAYRSYFFSVLKGIQTHHSIAAWWQSTFQAIQSQPSILLPVNSGLILCYLLDRCYLSLSWEEIAIIFPLRGIEWKDLGRPWKLRRPEEHATFVETLTSTKSSESVYAMALGGLALLLLQYGLKGVAELSRQLTTEEIEAAVQQRCLLTLPVYADVYLPYPQSPDIRLGHLLIDSLRMFLWKHRNDPPSGKTRRSRNTWSFPVNIAAINTIEQILCSHRWYRTQGILVPRPETKGHIFNPYRHQQAAERDGNALSQLPPWVKEQVNAFIKKRYLEDHIAFITLKHDIASGLRFLHFVQQQGALERIDEWDRQKCTELFKAFDEQIGINLADLGRSRLFSHLLIWFDTLAELDFPVPPGYKMLYKLTSYPTERERSVPPEALMDRVFRDGVCQHRDPYVRLALTIQYYCGTRIQETLDMHLFSLWEDEEQRVFLTIPIGKGKEERLFPIVPVGMEPLVTLMDEIVQSQFRSGHLSARVLANSRYLATDLEKASSWNYLFDRFTYNAQPRKAVLSMAHVERALHEATLLAAHVDPSGFFVDGTYYRHCQRQIRSGEICKYLAMSAGVTTCPICGGKLKGERGERCWRTLRADYTCPGVAPEGAWFCPVCDGPLAKPIRITTHLFRHNSVTRASRRGLPMTYNMALHGHRDLKMHKHYNHPELKELYEKVQDVMEAMHLRNAQMQALLTPGQVVVGGVAQTPSLEQYYGLTLRRSWRRETSGIWGGFVANMLSDEGVQSPVKGREEIYITAETYAHTVAQYRYDALGLAISEVSLEHRTRGKQRAQVPPYLNRQMIEQLVTQHPALNEHLSGNLPIRLLQGEIKRQRARLEELAAMLQPWWDNYSSIDQLVISLTPTDIDPFYKEVSDSA